MPFGNPSLVDRHIPTRRIDLLKPRASHLRRRRSPIRTHGSSPIQRRKTRASLSQKLDLRRLHVSRHGGPLARNKAPLRLGRGRRRRRNYRLLLHFRNLLVEHINILRLLSRLADVDTARAGGAQQRLARRVQQLAIARHRVFGQCLFSAGALE